MMSRILSSEIAKTKVCIDALFEQVKAECDKQDVDALFDAAIELRDLDIELRTLNRLYNTIERTNNVSQ